MFRIDKRYIDEMIAHAREDAPIECCGILGGEDGRVLQLYRAKNAEESEFRYSVESHDLLRIYRECDERDWDFVGIYHSHTSSEAYPSPTDVRLAALWPEALYFLVSLSRSESPDVRAYRIVDGQVSEEELEIV